MALDWKQVSMAPSGLRAEVVDLVLFVLPLSNGKFLVEVMGEDGSLVFRKADCPSIEDAKKRAEGAAMEDVRLRAS